jgi:c-di-AMP phosphodiesterase-like protein
MIKSPWFEGENMDNIKIENENKVDFFKKIDYLKQILDSELIKSSRVFIMPHRHMDFDALASAAAFYKICTFYGKDTYIVTNDKEKKMKSSFRLMYNELKRKCKFITTNELELLRDKDELLLLTDTNTTNLIPISNIDSFSNIIIVDHHSNDSNTIKTDKLFIDTDMSSASEIAFYLMKSMDIYIETSLAQYLLAGIYLDTNGLFYIPTPFTLGSVTKILEYGANIKNVQKLFTISNFEDDRTKERIINDLIDSTRFFYDSELTYTISYNEYDNDIIYKKHLLAEAADRMLKYELDVAFIIGYIDRENPDEEDHKNRISIKVRSKSNEIDAGKIMNLFGGGGDEYRAACEIDTNDVNYIINRIIEIMETYRLIKNKKLELK